MSRSRRTRHSARASGAPRCRPLIWVTSMIGSRLARSSASSRFSGLPSKVSTENMRPLLRLPLWGIASTSAPVVFWNRPGTSRDLRGSGCRTGKTAPDGRLRWHRRGTARCGGDCCRPWWCIQTDDRREAARVVVAVSQRRVAFHALRTALSFLIGASGFDREATISIAVAKTRSSISADQFLIPFPSDLGGQYLRVAAQQLRHEAIHFGMVGDDEESRADARASREGRVWWRFPRHEQIGTRPLVRSCSSFRRRPKRQCANVYHPRGPWSGNFGRRTVSIQSW